MLIIYQLIISLLLIISPLIIFYRISKNKEDPKRFKEKFAIPSKKKGKRKTNMVSWCKCWRTIKYYSNY